MREKIEKDKDKKWECEWEWEFVNFGRKNYILIVIKNIGWHILIYQITNIKYKLYIEWKW